LIPKIYILFFFRHAWILFIAITFINEWGIRKKAKSFLEAHPEREVEYYRFWRKHLILENIPWLIIAIGDITGMTKNVFDYFFPGMLNPIVLLFHFSIIILWSISIYWVYFDNGAEFLATYPNRFNGGEPKGKRNNIKIIFALMLIFGIAAEIFMWTHKGLPPNFH
jgi:hypothetical protein